MLVSCLTQSGSRPQFTRRTGVFCGWCELRGLEPCSASLVQLADFLIFLFETKCLLVSVIRGYSCSLAPVLHQSGIDISTDPDLSSLFHSFVVPCPPCLPRLPAWDLSLILWSLLCPPYEPLQTALLRDVSLKSLFL